MKGWREVHVDVIFGVMARKREEYLVISIYGGRWD
jgi:hypothetical protein